MGAGFVVIFLGKKVVRLLKKKKNAFAEKRISTYRRLVLPKNSHLRHHPLDAYSALNLAPPERQRTVRVLRHLLRLAALEVGVPNEPSLVETLTKRTRGNINTQRASINKSRQQFRGRQHTKMSAQV